MQIFHVPKQPFRHFVPVGRSKLWWICKFFHVAEKPFRHLVSERMSERMSERILERMSEDMSERMSKRMSEEMPERMSGEMVRRYVGKMVTNNARRQVRKRFQECQTECQKMCEKKSQKECQVICQKECQKKCQKECQKECQKRCQKACQKRCQKEFQECHEICQKEFQECHEICQKMCKECHKDCQQECQTIFYNQYVKLRVTGRDVGQGTVSADGCSRGGDEEAEEEEEEARRGGGGGGGDEADIKSTIKPHLTHTQWGWCQHGCFDMSWWIARSKVILLSSKCQLLFDFIFPPHYTPRTKDCPLKSVHVKRKGLSFNHYSSEEKLLVTGEYEVCFLAGFIWVPWMWIRFAFSIWFAPSDCHLPGGFFKFAQSYKPGSLWKGCQVKRLVSALRVAPNSSTWCLTFSCSRSRSDTFCRDLRLMELRSDST